MIASVNVACEMTKSKTNYIYLVKTISPATFFVDPSLQENLHSILTNDQ